MTDNETQLIECLRQVAEGFEIGMTAKEIHESYKASKATAACDLQHLLHMHTIGGFEICMQQDYLPDVNWGPHTDRLLSGPLFRFTINRFLVN